MLQVGSNQEAKTFARTRISKSALVLTVLSVSILVAALVLQTSSPSPENPLKFPDTQAAVARSSVSRIVKSVKSLVASHWSRPLTTVPIVGGSWNSNSSTPGSMAKKTPVYFVSHGGPTTMYETKHPVFPKLQAMGREITQKVKPSAIVVFSAHWQAQRSNTIEVNVSEQEPLLYDYYGFPKHFYEAKFPNKGSAEVARKVIGLLKENGIRTEEVERGLDHGVFVPFKIMFDAENPVTVPIVQVSLFDDDTDAEAHIRLGRAVQKLREENILIVASGMAVHNLRYIMMARSFGGPNPAFAVNFDQALKGAAEAEAGPHRDELLVDLLERPDARHAHPTFEHLLPIHIAAGAAGEDQGKQLFTMVEGGGAWAQYRFGEIESGG